MNLQVQFDTKNIDWNVVVDILQKVGMAYHTNEIHKRAFNNSRAVVFVFDKEKLIGFGRSISDGEYQGAIYDLAVHPSYQGKGIGKMILQNIIKQIPNCNFILYASPGKEEFYKKVNFKRLKTGMALFLNSKTMTDKGFTE